MFEIALTAWESFCHGTRVSVCISPFQLLKCIVNGAPVRRLNCEGVPLLVSYFNALHLIFPLFVKEYVPPGYLALKFCLTTFSVRLGFRENACTENVAYYFKIFSFRGRALMDSRVAKMSCTGSSCGASNASIVCGCC